MSVHRPCLVLGLALLMGLSGNAMAQSAGRLALQIDHAKHGKGKRDVARSMARQLEAQVVPLLESLGYTVDPVHEAKRAIKTGDYHFALKLKVDARPVYLVHEARQYRKKVISDHDAGVSAWADFRLFGWRKKEGFVEGKVGPIDSRVHELADSRPIIDDEDSVSRVLAGEVFDVVDELTREYSQPLKSLKEDE